MFVRKKKVKGKEYAYLVKNRWTKKGPRQKVIRYIGSVATPERLTDHTFDITHDTKEHEFLAGSRVLGLYKGLIERELINHGFQKIRGMWVNDCLVVDLRDHSVKKKTRNAAIELNEGFLCEGTIRQLRRAFLKEEITGRKLAESILEVGIKITPENFVLLAERLMPQQ